MSKSAADIAFTGGSPGLHKPSLVGREYEGLVLPSLKTHWIQNLHVCQHLKSKNIMPLMILSLTPPCGHK